MHLCESNVNLLRFERLNQALVRTRTHSRLQSLRNALNVLLRRTSGRKDLAEGVQNTSLTSAFPSFHSASSFLSLLISFRFCLLEAFAWKNFVFLSLSVNHSVLPRCFHSRSSSSRRNSSSFLRACSLYRVIASIILPCRIAPITSSSCRILLLILPTPPPILCNLRTLIVCYPKSLEPLRFTEPHPLGRWFCTKLVF